MYFTFFIRPALKIWQADTDGTGVTAAKAILEDRPIDIFNNGDAVLESSYDGTEPVVNMSDLSGIELLEINVR